VRLPGCEKLFNSAVLEVDSGHHYLLLDELSPADGHKRIPKAAFIVVFARTNGVEVSFRTKVKKIDTAGRIATYRVDFPKEVNYLERRSTFRVPLSAAGAVQFHAKRQGAHRTLTGFLVDISRTGCSAILDYYADIPRGELIPTCSVHMPEGEHVFFSMDICSSWRVHHNNALRIGGKILMSDNRTRDNLQRIVAKLEREYRKRLTVA
jgi:c-di-GMP-binding flagellar brake protein YcgR